MAKYNIFESTISEEAGAVELKLMLHNVLDAICIFHGYGFSSLLSWAPMILSCDHMAIV